VQCSKQFFYQEEPAATPVLIYSGLYGQSYSFDLIKRGKKKTALFIPCHFQADVSLLFLFLFFHLIFSIQVYIERLLDKRWVVIIDRDRTIDYVYCVDQQPAGD
jgi:hypothetical protein